MVGSTVNNTSKKILESFPVGTAITGVSGTIVAWDKKSEKLFKVKANDAIGNKISDYFSNSKETFEKYLSLLHSQKINRTYKKVFLRETAKKSIYIEIVFSSFKRDSGDVGVILVFRDVTQETFNKLERARIDKENQQLLGQIRAQRERLKILVSNIPGIVWEAEGKMGETNFKMKYISRFVEKMLGYSLRDLIADSRKVINVFDTNEFEKVVQTFIKAGKTKKKRGVTQFKLARKDNKKIWTETHFSILPDLKSDIATITGITFDINTRKKIEEQIEKSEERFRSLFELAPDVIYSIDREGKFVELNPAFEKVTGFKIKDWVGRSYLDLTHPDDREFAEKIFKDGINGHVSDPYEIRLATFSGNFIVAEFRSKPKIIDGIIEGKLGIFRDVSERKHQELQRSYMLGIASHELKTPLASIKVFVQILQKKFKKEDNTKYDEYLVKIDQQINKLTKLISDILDIEKIKAGKFEVLYDIFDFDELVKEVIEEVAPTLVSHKIIVAGKTKKYMMGDKSRISRVISNLLSNASKYSPGKDKVLVSLSSDSKTVTINIHDFGIGIAKDDIKKIFEPFYHSDTNDTRKIPSVGLGLYISSEIVKAHGGKLWVESKINKGSTFFLSLPIKQKG